MFKYLIFVNGAKKPIAGFAFREDAVAWIEAKRWDKHKPEIREVTDEQPVAAESEKK